MWLIPLSLDPRRTAAKQNKMLKIWVGLHIKQSTNRKTNSTQNNTLLGASGLRSFRYTVFSYQEQRVISLLGYIKERVHWKFSASQRNNFLYMVQNDHVTKRPDTELVSIINNYSLQSRWIAAEYLQCRERLCKYSAAIHLDFKE